MSKRLARGRSGAYREGMQELDERLTSAPIAGTLAFVFTDISGSTQLWERHPHAMKAALARHDAILHQAIEASGGRVVKTTGDGLMAVFPTAFDGVAASLGAQRALADEPWLETGPLRVRVGLHAGEAERRAGDYFGPTINRTARIMSAGHGGQVLLSAAAAALAADRLPEGASFRDLGEYRLKDLGRAERVFQLLHPALEADFPPLTTVDRGAANLPIQAAPFVGRRTELADVERRLDDPTIRLLTLTGPGGTGKTSLAIQAASARLDRFRDGVAFVDLATTSDTEALLLALGRVVGVGEAHDRSLSQQLIDRLRDRQMLLLLDNFEQVTAAAGVTTELLNACPDITFLITSREPLHVRAEHVYAVPPMALPPTGRGQVTAEQVGAYEAVQLFVDRARAVRPDFELDDRNASTIGDICRRLDGLPLAIELAAARLRLFSPEALLDRLGSSLELLRSSGRDLPERQQTLRATIDWSYQLLEPGEQRLFEALAVFADADLRAVEAVVAMLDAPAGTAVDVIEALASLLEKSLVRQVEMPQGEPRSSMLETIREYAAERLDQGPAGPMVRRAHAAYYADLAGQLRRDLAGPSRDRAMATMAAEVENLRLAWTHWIVESDLGQLTKLADSLLILNEARGWYQDSVVLTTGMLGVLAGTTSTPELASQEVALRMSLARALMATQGYTSEVAQAYTRALDLFEGGRDLRQHYSVLRGLAGLYLLRSEFDKAADLGEQILAIAEREDDPNMRIDGHLVVGSTIVFTGDLERGLSHLDAAIELFESSPATAVGSRQGNDPRVACLTTAAFSLWLLGFPDRAVERAHAAVDFAQRLGQPYTTAYARFHAGLLHLWLGEPAKVLDQASRLLEIADEYDFRIWSAVGSCLLGAAQANLGRLETGLAEIREGLTAYQGLMTPPVFWPMLLYVDAGARVRAGAPADGLAPLDEAITLMGGPTSSATFMPELLLLRGDLLIANGAPGAEAGPDAVAEYRAGLEAARRMGARMSELRALTRLLRSASDDAGGSRRQELEAVLQTFDEGFGTADLIAAREALAPAQAG